MNASAVQEFLRKSHHQQTRFPTREKRRDHYDKLAAAYRSLGPEEAASLVDFALESWDLGKRDLCEEILLYLACLTAEGLAGHHAELIRRQIIYPFEIYRGADHATRDVLLSAFPQAGDPPGVSLNLLMGALAWIGDEHVVQRFGEWQARPPHWAPLVASEPRMFAHVAGWDLQIGAPRRDLYHRHCYQLVAPRRGTALANQPASASVPRVDICAWCGDWLATLLDLHCQAPELAFLADLGERLRVPFCRNCTAHGPTFGELDAEGEAHWSTHNQRPGGLTGAHSSFPEGHLVLGGPRTTPYEAHVLVLSDGLSQVGGHPSWEHEAEYPQCPSCRRTMTFVGQVDVSDLGPPAEGIYYAFVCSDCRLVAATYQTR